MSEPTVDEPDRPAPDSAPPAAEPPLPDPDPLAFTTDPPAPKTPPAPPEPPPVNPFCRLLHTAVGFVTAFLVLRTLVVEPFGVPTGSMAPTFIGNHREAPCPRCGHPVRVGDPGGGDRDGHFADASCPNCGKKKVSLADGRDVQGDRLLVDKNVFSVRPPRRWEVAVFRCPVDLSKPYVKRVVGLPGEVITVKDGDVYAGGELCRKSLVEMRETRLVFFDMGFAPPDGWGRRWLVDPPGDPNLPPVTLRGPKSADAAVLANGVLVLDAGSSPQATAGVSYRHCDLDEPSPQIAEQSVRSWNAYNGPPPRRPTPPPAYDFSVECDVEVTAGSGSFACRLFDGADAVNAEFAAGAGADGRMLLSRDRHGGIGPVWDFALRPGRVYRLEFAFVDRRVLIAVDGKEVAAPFDLNPPAKRGEVSRPVQFGVRGCRVEVRNLRLFHDIYYTTTGRNGTREPTRLGPTEYFMLGDNSGNSQDSREWSVPGVPEADFIGKPFLVHQPLRLARVAVGGKERVFQTLDWTRLRWLR